MAFLSYSHKDSDTADWLHESLEQFRVPPMLVGRLTEQGPVPRRLTPIFRDRHELVAASDLGEEIEEAITGSRFLIVLCSPAAVQSRWINQEIECFKRLQGENRILAAIIEGEPFASDIPGREHEECFPPALRVRYDGRGRPTTQRAEPIAADLRATGDGRRMGLLKIIAGMLDVGLDDLAQREAHRRQRRLTLITAASVVGMLVTSGLAYTAIDARDEARDQRREAEKLVGFMLGDLREKLEPIGRLDVLDSVGVKALAYYSSQNKADLSDAALAQRSKALTLMGEMANTRGNLDGALARYAEALATTGELVRRVPKNGDLLFDHAQNVFWVGYIDYQRGGFDKAAAAFTEYGKLADRMIKIAPAKSEYRLERIYADAALGSVLFDQRRYRAAANIFEGLLDQSEALAASSPTKLDYQKQLVNALGWLADSRENVGEIDEAIAYRQRGLALAERLWTANSGDTYFKRDELSARRALTRLFASRGQMREAFEQAALNLPVLAFLMKTEPNNTEWIQTGANVRFEQAELQLAAGRIAEARMAADSGCAAARQLAQRDRTVAMWRSKLQRRCATVRARIALRSGDTDAALTEARQLLVLARGEREPTGRALATATANMLLGAALRASDQNEAALGALQTAAAAWPTGVEETPQDLALKATLFDLAGRDSAPIRKRLAAIGYRHPDYLKKAV